MSNIDYIQAQINLLHKQLDDKQSELDAKYEERNKILREKRDNKSSSKLSNIESNFQEDMINDMTNDLEDLF